MRKFLKSTALIITVFSTVIFLLSLLVPYANPDDFWPFPLFGLGFVYMLIIQIAFILFWILKRRIYFLIPLLSLFIGGNHVSKAFVLQFKKREIPENTISLYSQNLRAFGLFGPTFEKETSLRIFEFYRNNSPDIIAFQEYFDTERKKEWKFSPVDSLKKITQLPYQRIEFAVNAYRNSFGLAVYSKFPIVGGGRISDFAIGTNFAMYADIDVHGKIWRIYNAHFTSFHLSDDDLKLIENFTTEENKKRWDGSVKLIKRLQKGYENRADQAEAVAKHASNSPYPVVFCGDFNDSPQSFSYHLLGKFFNDAFVESGWGFGATYNGPIPLQRIDYIFTSPELSTYNFKRHFKNITDHYPLSVQIALKK